MRPTRAGPVGYAEWTSRRVALPARQGAKLPPWDNGVMSNPATLQRYAHVILHVGVGLQSGQRLVVRAPIEAADLVREVVRAAYEHGSPYVHVLWSDDAVTLTRFESAPEGSFSEVPYGAAEAMEGMAARGDAVVSILGSDPELLAGVDAGRVAESRAANQKAMAPFYRYIMSDGVAWTIAAVPTHAWAKRVFPDAAEGDALARLWDAVTTAVRLDRDDPVAAWSEHVDGLERLASRLNDHRFDVLHFTAPGTDLTVGLADGHLWKGGGSVAPSGTPFVANLPTEEVFTAPYAARVNGTVAASKPLAYNGRLIEGLRMTFEEGVAVHAEADRGQEALDGLLATDDGARRLGEVALVSVDSPIHQSGVLFLETLFDENAAVHIALGRAYRFNVEGGPSMSEGEAAEAGLNDSLTHVDFMIGSEAMDVDGIKSDGTVTPIMRAGRFVLD